MKWMSNMSLQLVLQNLGLLKASCGDFVGAKCEVMTILLLQMMVQFCFI